MKSRFRVIGFGERVKSSQTEGVPLLGGRVAAPFDKGGVIANLVVFGWQHVSSAGFPTPTSLASAARISILNSGILLTRVELFLNFPWLLAGA